MHRAPNGHVAISAPGSGGYGPPSSARDRALLCEDPADGYVS